MKRWDVLICCIICTALGGLGGIVYSRASHASKGPSGGGHEPAAVPEALSEATLRNLGVWSAKIYADSFSKTRDVPAVVDATPFNERPVFAPIGGRVQEIRVEPGTVVLAGETVMTLLRDPIPRPRLTLTEGILKPANETIHQSVVELRKSRDEMAILKTELDRIAQYTGKVGGEDLPILPRQTEIDLRYKLLRAQQSHEEARLELEKHGFTKEQVAAVEAGGVIPNLGEDSWRRALERNGLWPKSADALLDVLPKRLHELPWVVATVGELAASGLIQTELIEWLKAVPEDCGHFLEIGSYLQSGASIADIRALHDMNAFDPVVEVKAPLLEGVGDWDVARLDVKVGARVAVGARLVTLLDPRVMFLRAEPVGAEQATVLKAVEGKVLCEARPLVAGSGPLLRKVELVFVTQGTQGMTAHAKVKNEPLAALETPGGKHRSWRLREGLRYILRVPIETLKDVAVLPSEAMTIEGSKRLVWVHAHGAFNGVEVEVLHQDEDVVVVRMNPGLGLSPGDEVVQSGAYALSLALKAQTSAVDPHAGHQH